MFSPDAMLAGGSNLLGGIINNIMAGDRQEEAQKFNAQQALDNRNWQTQMSNTAYQRSMQDMRLAGLNPILAYQKGGASTPGGAQASTVAAPVHDIGLGAAVNTAMARDRLTQELENMRETNRNINTDTMKKGAEVTNTYTDTMRKLSEIKNIDEQTRRRANETIISASEAARAKLDQSYWESSAASVLRPLAQGGKDVANIIKPATDIVGSWRGVMGGMRDHSAWKYNQRWYGD